jgi:hypothetical protein
VPSYLAAAKAATVTGAGYAGAGFDSTIGAALVAASGASAPIGAYAGAAVAFVASYVGKAVAIVSAALAQALASADPLVGDLLDLSLGPAIDLCGKAIAAAPGAAATAYTTCGELLVYGGEAAVKYLSAAAAFAINVITNLDAPVGDFLDVVLGGSISALVAAWAALPGLYAAATAKLAIGVDATVSALVGIAKLSASQLQAALASKSISDLLDVTLGNLFNSIQFVATPVYNGAAYAIAEAYLRAGEGVSALLGVGQSGIDAIAAAWAYLAATGAGTAVGSARVAIAAAIGNLFGALGSAASACGGALGSGAAACGSALGSAASATGSALAPVGSACVSGANSCIDLLGAGASKGIDLLGAGASKAGGALASVPTRVSVFFNRVPL